MATTTLSKAAASYPAKAGTGVCFEYNSVALTANPTAADNWYMFKLPANCIVIDVYINSDDMDTNGTPTMLWDLGDLDGATRWLSNSTISQTGGTTRTDRNLGYEYTSEATIVLTCDTAAATFAAGTIIVGVLYTMNYT